MGTVEFAVVAAIVLVAGAIIAIHVLDSWRRKLARLNDRLLWRLQAEFVKEGLSPQHASPGKLTRKGYQLIIPLGLKVLEPGEDERLRSLRGRIRAQCEAFAAENGATLLFARIRLDDECLMVGVK
ncbi:MAG: hypothetical protein Q7R85_02565 [bacterium]|nr:hypothetical protein [bacterium]